jgi:hypothetical protein
MGRQWRPIFWYRLVGLLVMLQACVHPFKATIVKQ